MIKTKEVPTVPSNQSAETLAPEDSVTMIDNTTSKSYTLRLLSGTMGPRMIDTRKLFTDLKMCTFDPGYSSTGSCESSITYIDGEQGTLLYRGYPIEDIAEQCDILEVAHLLLHGELPNRHEKHDFEKQITYHTMVHEQLLKFYQGFRRDAHPMAIMCGVTGALSAFYPDSLNTDDTAERTIATHRLIAKMPTIAAMAYKYSLGQPFIYPQNALHYSDNFLRMCFSVPAEDYKINPVLGKAMDRIMILHADHEQNASTSTVRLAGSSGANPFACIAAGIASLWGRSHGGANESVLEMLKQINHIDRIPEFISRAKNKNDPFRLMGFGHRVYKNFDPRAQILRRTCHEVLGELGIQDDPMLNIALELEKIALEDDYFVEKKLYPNVDFYSGIILKAIGFPTSMFTVLFVVARTIGWVSQWKEMVEQETRIGRPRQLYTGLAQRSFRPLSMRS